jgi:hypothetical protein
MDGRDHVYAASTNFVPGDLKGSMHEKMVKPIGGK